MVAWLYSYLGWTTGNNSWITAIGYRLVWIILPLMCYVLGYYAMLRPDLFRRPLLGSNGTKRAPAKEEELQADLKRLYALMEKEKPFLNSQLTLTELAELCGLTTHSLSYTINEGGKQNFASFINRYRVEEFKRLAQSDEYQHQTILAIAFAAGFNSKTTFNTAFKEFTEKTPRQFLQSLPKKSSETRSVL